MSSTQASSTYSHIVGRGSERTMSRRTHSPRRSQKGSSRRSLGARRNAQEIAPLHYSQGRQRRRPRNRSPEIFGVLFPHRRRCRRRFRSRHPSRATHIRERGTGRMLCRFVIFFCVRGDDMMCTGDTRAFCIHFSWLCDSIIQLVFLIELFPGSSHPYPSAYIRCFLGGSLLAYIGACCKLCMHFFIT